MKKNWIYFVIIFVSILLIIFFGSTLNKADSFLDAAVNFCNIITNFVIYLHSLLAKFVGFFLGDFGEEWPLFIISLLTLAGIAIASFLDTKIYLKFRRISFEDFILYSVILCIIFCYFHI